MKDETIKTEPFSIEYLINKVIPHAYNNKSVNGLSENSVFASKANKQIPENSITKALEQKLNPTYMNSVFTWAQIEKALNQAHYMLPKNENNPF